MFTSTCISKINNRIWIMVFNTTAHFQQNIQLNLMEYLPLGWRMPLHVVVGILQGKYFWLSFISPFTCGKTLMRNSEFYTPYLLHCSPQDKRRTFSTQVNASLDLNLNTVKPVYKGHSREPENVPFMSSCPLYIYYSLMGKSDCPL